MLVWSDVLCCEVVAGAWWRCVWRWRMNAVHIHMELALSSRSTTPLSPTVLAHAFYPPPIVVETHHLRLPRRHHHGDT